MADISVKHKKFADGVLGGKTMISAYYEAGYKAKKDATAWASASEILRNPNVRAYIKEKLAEQEAVDKMRLERIRNDAIVQLQRIIRDGKLEDKVKLDAIKDALDRTGFKPIDRVEQDIKGNIAFNLNNVDISSFPEPDADDE